MKSGKVLESPGGSTTKGQALDQWTDNSAAPTRSGRSSRSEPLSRERGRVASAPRSLPLSSSPPVTFALSFRWGGVRRSAGVPSATALCCSRAAVRRPG
ncbi:hypothetical protein [Streptomyces olivochromogenes]